MISKPKIFSASHFSKSDLETLAKSNSSITVIDTYLTQLEELFEITNPKLIHSINRGVELDHYLKQIESQIPKNKFSGTWVYFPWKKVLVHILDSDDYYLLRTSRNKNLITLTEQNILRSQSIAIAGLSIGSVMARSLVQMGIGDKFKVADHDTLSTSNLNRLPASILDIGKSKAEIFAHSIYELDPYLDLNIFDKGISEKNIDDFLSQQYIPSLIIDAIDDFKMKVLLRLKAKEYRIPLLMFTNLYDSVLVDIERHDLDAKLQPFHGLLGKDLGVILTGTITEELKKKYAVLTVGKHNVPPRAIQSLQEINQTLVGRPQLFGTLSLASGIATYIVREIILGSHTDSGRYKVQLPDCIIKQV